MKRSLKQVVALMLVVIMSMCVLTACGGSDDSSKESTDTSTTDSSTADSEGTTETVKIGFTNLAESDVFCKARADQFQAAIDAAGADYEVTFTDANNDIQKQLDQIDNFIAQKVDLIVVVAVDTDAVVPGIQAANSAGIPVIAFGMKPSDGDFTFVGSQNYDAGKMQGDYMAEVLPDDAKVLYLGGTNGLSHATERREGFTDGCLKVRTDVELLADLPGDYDMAKGMSITEDWIQTFTEFDAIIAANDQMALGAIQALKAANRLEGVLVSGVDGTQEACQAIKDGEMAQSILQDAPAQGQACYETTVTLLKGETVKEDVIVPFTSITADNVDDFLE